MTSIVAFSTLGGSTFSQAAGDLFLAQSLTPTHLEPTIAADPSRSCFLMVNNGGDNEGSSGSEDLRRLMRAAGWLDRNDPESLTQPISEELRKRFKQAMSSLTPREELILALRFGLEDGRPWTLEKTAKECGLSRESIRRLEALALRKLCIAAPRNS